jgi:hypothetical protein
VSGIWKKGLNGGENLPAQVCPCALTNSEMRDQTSYDYNGSLGKMRAKWFDTLISADMYLKRSPAASGWQHSFRLGFQRLVNGDGPTITILFSRSATASFVLPYHVLDRFHAQYPLVHFKLYLSEGAEYNLVIFLGDLVLDDVLGSTPIQIRPSESST